MRSWLKHVLLGCTVATMLASCTTRMSDLGVVAWVNGEPVTVAEFQSCFTHKHRAQTFAHFASYGATDKADFWTRRFGNERPIDYAREETLRDVIATKVQQIILKQDGIMQDISYGALQKKLVDENTRRALAVANHEIIYGPVKWEEAEYFDHELSDNLSAWKNTVGPQRFPLLDEQVRRLYEQMRQSFRLPDSIAVEVIAVSYAVMPRERALRVLSDMRGALVNGRSVADVTKSSGAKAMSYHAVFDESTTKGDELGRPLQLREAQRLQPGDIGGIVEEGEGCLIMKCISRKSDRYPSLERLRGLILDNHLAQQYRILVDDMIKTARVKVNKRVYNAIVVE